MHNHPSGDPNPSDEDVDVTRRLIDAGKMINICVLDHVIVGYGTWWGWTDEKKALRELSLNQVKTDDTSAVKQAIRELKIRQEEVFQELLYRIPDPEYDRVYEISERARLDLINAGFED